MEQVIIITFAYTFSLVLLLALWTAVILTVQSSVSKSGILSEKCRIFLVTVFIILFFFLDYYFQNENLSFAVTVLVEGIIASILFNQNVFVSLSIESLIYMFIFGINAIVKQTVNILFHRHNVELGVLFCIVLLDLAVLALIREFLDSIIKRVIKLISVDKYYLVSILISSISIYLTVYMCSKRTISMSINVWKNCMLFAVILVIGTGCFCFIKEQTLNLEFMRMRNRFFSDENERVKTIYAKEAILYHDMKHHLRNVDILLQKEDIREAREYIKYLFAPYEKENVISYSGILELDAALSYMKETMESKDIEVYYEIERLDEHIFLWKDISCLISNIIENAMEASDKCQEKRVMLKIRGVRGFLFVKCENTCVAEEFNKGKVFKTTKQNKKLHGWGIKSMRLIVEKYNGEISISENNGIATVDVMLCELEN